jgi:Rps23 Pro-64 3,4-dihydroxylase Tpa1-like proline 4-hydroxylase
MRVNRSNQSHVAADQVPDHVTIRGVRIRLDSILNPSVLRAAGRLRDEFVQNAPFPHVVIEGLFSPELLQLTLDEFGSVSGIDWDRYDSADEVKRGSSQRAQLGPATQLYFSAIHSRAFVQFVERVSGIDGLLPDPKLFAGGMHEIPDGGHFAIHLDFNRHPVTGLRNRLVLITYLNKEWQPSYGGALELWNRADDTKVVEVSPRFGRTIIFVQSPETWHGHPVPVQAPDRRPRRSLAAYYYGNDGQSEAGTFRTTLVAARQQGRARTRIVPYIRYCTPPIVVDAVRKIVGIMYSGRHRRR